MTIPPLSFEDLRVANADRCGNTFHPIDAWTPTAWAVAMAGEVGEVLNLVKKFHRGDFGEPGADEYAVGVVMLGHELADVVIYLDLLLARLEIPPAEGTFDDLVSAVADDVVERDVMEDAADLFIAAGRLVNRIVHSVDARGDMTREVVHLVVEDVIELDRELEALARRFHVSLGLAVAVKFNIVSHERGSDIRLPTAASPGATA